MRASRSRGSGSEGTVPAKVPQPHGGALYAGGLPGHDGSKAGRRKSEVREALLAGAAEAVPVLTSQLRLAKKDPQLAQGAADKLLKYGVGTQKELAITREVVQERLRASIEIIRRHAPQDVAERIIMDMKTEWTRST